jgi:hypothetical protein
MFRKIVVLLVFGALGCAWLAAADNPTKKKIESWRQNARAAATLVQASIRCDVKPKDAHVYVDGALVGTARDFNSSKHPLYLFPGEHSLEFRHPGHETYSTTLRLLPEQDMRIKVRMNKVK